MELKVECVKNGGDKSLLYYVDGEELSKYRASQKLTGTENEYGYGVFDDENEVWFEVDVEGEEHRKEFKFDTLPKFDCKDAYKQEINHRVKVVREWVKGLKSMPKTIVMCFEELE